MSAKRELSRAELVRMRRAQQAGKELQQTTQRATKPVIPVTSRAAPTRPMVKPAPVKPRRFNVALGLPEFHLHRPSISISNRPAPWRIISVCIVIFLGTAIYLALSMADLHVQSATVLGNHRVSREEIESVLGLVGQSIFTVQPNEMAARLRLNYPELASVEVNAYLPNHVYITLTEREPVIVWKQGDGYTWIDASGVAFRPRGEVPGLISVNGLAVPPVGASSTDDPLNPPPFMQKELVDAILQLAPHVPAGSTMVFDPVNGLGFNDSRGWQAFLGTTSKDMPLKVRVYQSLVDSLMSRGRIPQFISVVYPDAPFYRMAPTDGQAETIGNGP
jgi:POTRA domain, FtsQ-type